MANYLSKARRAKNNEFYTEYKTMEYLFESPEQGPQFCEFVKNKIIYLPCDTEDSNIYKYFVANKERLQIKEILRTSDDYYGHLDLYEKCDLVFTNPPFTKLYKYTKWLEYDLNKKFVLWWSWMSICFSPLAEFCSGRWKILTYNGEVSLWSELNQKGVNCLIFSNIENAKALNLAIPKSNKKVEELEMYDSIPYINKMKDFPDNYYGQIYIPIYSYLNRIQTFENLNKSDIISVDGKNRRKVLVRLKRE